MKNLNTIFKSKCLMLAIVLFSVCFGYAQTVTVPANCIVINVGTGTGGVLGAGGKVTEGGIVAMPDPSGGGLFTFTPPVVSPPVTTATWSLKGDLSNTTVTPSAVNNVPPQPPAGLTANVYTCNKSLRSSEGVAPSLSSWARSKGRVKVSWTGAGCGSSLTFDVFKTFTASPVTNVPIIVGPDCLKPNTQYTYSVDQIVSDNTDDSIGFDSYYWSGLPAALATATTTYTSADRSSITFTTGNAASLSTFTLQCCYGRVNPNTADGGPFTAINQTVTPTRSTCVTKNILVSPAAPGYSTAPPSCLATNLSSFTVVYPNPVAGQTYTWTAPNTGWTLSTSLVPPANVNTQLTVTTGSNTNPGLLVLTISGACTDVVINYQIDRSITAPYTVIPTGTTTTCINATSSGNTYTLTPSVGGNPIQWFTVPASVTGVTLVNANTPTVTVNTSGASGSFTLSATSGVAACNSSSVSTTINIRPATPVFTASSPSCVPLSSPALTTFAVTPVAGATSYTWTLPSGWSNTGTAAQQTSANPTLVPPTNTSAVAAAALPPGTITVVANSATGCSSAVAATFTVNYIRITTNTLQSGAGNCDQYSINTNVSPCTGTITNWTVNGVTAVNSATVNIFGNTLTLCGSTAPPAGSVCANIVIGGVSYTTCSSTVATGTHGLRQASPKVILDGVTISPNPNSGRFTIDVSDFTENASATLTDFSSNEIKTYQLHKGENKIENQNLRKGTYFVVLNIDGKQETRQVIIK